jgi:hypothetical protein
MKAAASFQVFRTVFCRAIIIQAGKENPENQENAFAFSDNLKGKSLFLKIKKMNHACHSIINH